MLNNRTIQLAREYCEYNHEDQYRKGNPQTEYASHPMEVADILARNGYTDAVTQCVALLHDTVEDTPANIDEIREMFGYEIANGVLILSKNTLTEDVIDTIISINPEKFANLPKDELYKLRISFARRKVKRVKIADMIHNTQDLINLGESGREKKIKDAEGFYIPMGEKIARLMTKELRRNIESYRAAIKRISIAPPATQSLSIE